MFIYNAVLAYNAWIWGIPILIILIGGGLYLSFVTGSSLPGCAQINSRRNVQQRGNERGDR